MKTIQICPTCEGVGSVYKTEIERGGGSNGSDYMRTTTVQCKTCLGAGRVTSHLVYTPYLGEGGPVKWD